MLKMVCVLSLMSMLFLQVSVEAQQRGRTQTRGERDRYEHRRDDYRPQHQPKVRVIVVPQAYPQYPHYPQAHHNAYAVREARLMADRNLIANFMNHLSPNCFIKPNVDGWANQLYIARDYSGYYSFAGNYHHYNQVYQLQRDLVTYIMNGTCAYAY